MVVLCSETNNEVMELQTGFAQVHFATLHICNAYRLSRCILTDRIRTAFKRGHTLVGDLRARAAKLDRKQRLCPTRSGRSIRSNHYGAANILALVHEILAL